MRFAALVFISGIMVLTAPSEVPDDALAQIHAALVPLQAAARADLATRGATPAMLPIRHRLRDWIDGQLLGFAEDGAAAALQLRLNGALDAADLLCQRRPDTPDRCASEDSEWNATGFLGLVTVERPAWDRLIVATRMGILCGMDASTYAYEWRDGRWERFWENEQPIAPGKQYLPRNYEGASVAVDDPGAPASQLVLSLGSADWCTSNWRPVYYTLARIPAGGGAPALLLDVSETTAFQGVHDVPIRGVVGKDDALIEFTQGSRDSGVHSYQAVRHYSVAGDRVIRVDPIALGPRAFIEEWIAAGWTDAARWSVPGAPDFAAWHRRVQGESALGDFAADTTRCAEPGLWQVSAAAGDDAHPGTVWFVVRWIPPYIFRMAAIGDKPRAGCATADPTADAYRTLFPVDDWYQ